MSVELVDLRQLRILAGEAGTSFMLELNLFASRTRFQRLVPCGGTARITSLPQAELSDTGDCTHLSASIDESRSSRTRRRGDGVAIMEKPL